MSTQIYLKRCFREISDSMWLFDSKVFLYNHNHECALAAVKGKYSSARSWRSETICSETMWQSGPVMPDNGSVVNASCRCFFFSPPLFVFFKSQFFIQPKLL